VRRLIDFVVGALLLIALTPLLLVVSLAVYSSIGRPVLFRQERVGRHERPFTIVKFRTMTNARGADGDLLSDEERLTGFGRFLRATSLDELPELWNVARGHMSLIGPRPLPVKYLNRYDERQRRRHEIRPGITGWAQINGRNSTTWDERLEYDVWYLEHSSALLNLQIIWRTLFAVCRRRGVAADGHATMPEFLPDRRATRSVSKRE
jgi:lipopolysaccharide/colanic/teichoic acid biosynthesis glycosyltransferase